MVTRRGRVAAAVVVVMAVLVAVGACGGGGSHGNGDGGSGNYPGQSTVENDPSIICAGYTVEPDYSSTTYPCDASMTPDAIRAVLGNVTGILFLAGHFANSALPGDNGCSKSTLCGQQYDPGLLWINDPQYASYLTSAEMAFAIPGIRVDVSAADALTLMYDCLHNFPTGYQQVPIPVTAPIMPVDDVRTGEALVFTGSGSTLAVYRARVVGTITANQPPGTDLSGYSLTLAGGAAFTLTSDVVAAIAATTGSDLSATLELRKDADVAATLSITITCMQKDKYITQP